MPTYNGQLSKWWRTPSAQAAMERAAASRNARLNQIKEDFAARKREEARALEQWEVKEAR